MTKVLEDGPGAGILVAGDKILQVTHTYDMSTLARQYHKECL